MIKRTENRSIERDSQTINEIFSNIREINGSILPLANSLKEVLDSMPTDEHGKPSLKRHWQHHDDISETGKNYATFKNGFLSRMGGTGFIAFLFICAFLISLAGGYVARVTH